MRDWKASFVAKQWQVAYVMVLTVSLLASSCAGSRTKRDRENGDQDSGDDQSAEGKNNDRDASEQETDSGNGGNEKDAADPTEPRYSGGNGGTQYIDAGKNTYDAIVSGNGGSGAEDPWGTGGSIAGSSAVDVPYESLQQMPNTTARVCPNSSFNDVATILGGSCDHICLFAHCVPNSMVPVQSAVNAFSPCDESSVCIPDSMINTTGGVQYKKCRSVGNLEGVCISQCNTDVASPVGSTFLPQDSCHESEKCVPCFDPLRGGLTAFNPCGNYTPSSCNPGPSENGFVFDKCCDGNGTCIPGVEETNPEIATLLKRDSCSGEDDLCVPALFTIQRYLPATCETQNGDEGRCLPGCIAPALAEEYPQQDCAVTEHCIPCAKDGVSTGACAINADSPGRDSE